MKLLLRHEKGELGPKTIDEWATPNGDEPLLIWMLRTIEEQGGERAELVAVREPDDMPGWFEDLRP